MLNEVLEETRQRVLDTSRRVTELTLELENENSKVTEMHAEFDRICLAVDLPVGGQGQPAAAVTAEDVSRE